MGSLEEKKFWETMIEKYLKPFDQIYTPMEEFKRETAKTKRELFEYRDSFIFSFLMINSFYVVLITMLRLQSPLKIPWTIFTSFDLNGLDGVHYTFDYNPPENMESPLVTISRTTIVLDILGLVFLLTFTLITTFQVFGMFLHRWQTFCQYVASTRLPLFESADAKDTNEEALNELMKFTKSSQEPEKDKKDKASNRLAERRMTIANMQEEKKKKGSQGDFINLEKQFKVRFQEAAEDDEVMRRLSIRRDTMALIQRRGSTFHQTEQRRRSSVAHSRATSFSASSGRGSIMYDVNVYDNNGYDGNNDYDDDDFTPRNRSRASVSFIQDDDSRSQESTL